MCNKDIREAAKNAGIRLWEVAAALGINDGNFSRKLRQELPHEEKIEPTGKKRAPADHKKIELKASGISSTLDMRGLTAEDAYIEIDRYFDAAIMAGMEEVTLLHGKGTGALRTAVHEYLRKHAHCEKFRIGKYGEGDTGVTIVTLK